MISYLLYSGGMLCQISRLGGVYAMFLMKALQSTLSFCNIDCIVTVINPTTGQDERRPIWEVASSHMARRTFIGTLYKQVKDPNLVGALSGHKEGSRAFARYREIDDDIRRDLIDLL